MIKIEIKGRLPSLNDYIAAINRNKFVGAKLKKDTEDLILWQIKSQKIPNVEKPCSITFYWHEENKRRDLDNIYSAKKMILDALQTAGVIENDSQKWVTDLFDIHPDIQETGGVTVIIKENETA